ncbi:MAG: MraY family glycosyltransferase [Candidatus Gracilibacteria bacterium]|nr:MraY family glycosyltransferase [Candidatus Gracilibacteria bacterium]
MNFVEIIMKYGAQAIFAFGLSVVFIFVAVKIFPKIGLMDRPWRYGLNRKAIPYYGGLAMFLAFIISVFCFVDLNPQVWGLLLGAFIIVVVGFLDDYLNLSPLVRLFAQFVAAVLLVHFGIVIFSINIPLLGVISFSSPLVYGFAVLSAAFTIVWVMTIVNVMNFLDGVSGLNSGVAFIAGLTLFFLSINQGLHADPVAQANLGVIALIVSMVALAFLIFDFPPAKILMGDTGSTFLGFVLATLAIFSGGKVATAFLVLGIPILDMIWVVLRRIFSGQKFWRGDLKHLHHRFLDFGLPAWGVVLIYLGVSAFFGFSAVAMASSEQKMFMVVGLVVLMLLLAVSLVFLPNKKSE